MLASILALVSTLGITLTTVNCYKTGRKSGVSLALFARTVLYDIVCLNLLLLGYTMR